jgi:hypothetical protein
MTARLAFGLLLLSEVAAGAETGVPLPPAPVRIVIPDAAAFDAALAGAYRRALTGTPDAADPVVAGWRRSQVGAKLEDQWGKLAGDVPWTWSEIMALRPRRLGLALLDAGALEAVLVIEGGATALPSPLAPGAAKTHGGAPYHAVARRSAGGAGETERRTGFAWAQAGGRLFLATSEEALLLALDELQAGRFFDPPLAGLASVDLDVAALGKDRYFRREFLFGAGEGAGHVAAALRLEGGELVEVRQGKGDAGPAGVAFQMPRATAAAWEPDGATLLPALRAALLEPLPTRRDRPVVPIVPLPPVVAASTDRYLVNLERPPAAEMPWEEGELVGWRELFQKNPVSGWGYALDADGARRFVFPWPERLDRDLLALCVASAARRGGPTTTTAGDTREIRVGADLPALALRRTGAYMWLGRSAAELADAPTPTVAGDLIRWARVDLDAVRTEAARWGRAEGPAAPERIRPLSDRVLGLLGWIPETTSLRIERRRSEGGWTERVVFGRGSK